MLLPLPPLRLTMAMMGMEGATSNRKGPELSWPLQHDGTGPGAAKEADWPGN